MLNGVNYLSSGSEYQYKLILKDVLGNEGYSYPSDPAEFYWDNNVGINAIFEEVSISSTFNSSLMNEYQDLGVLNIKIDPANGNRGVSKLNSLTFQVDPGSINSNKISNIRARIGETTIRTISYEGPKTYTL